MCDLSFLTMPSGPPNLSSAGTTYRAPHISQEDTVLGDTLRSEGHDKSSLTVNLFLRLAR